MSALSSTCPHCQLPLPGDGEAGCPRCGAATGPPTDTAAATSCGATRADPTAAAPNPGPAEQIGPYRVLGRLGQGGMGVVYRAEDPALRRQVAIKVMRPEYAAHPAAKARFLREARAAAAVEHDHVVTIHHVGEDAGTPFLAMQLLKGRTLAAALRADPRPAAAEVARVGRQIAAGLAAAHAAGLTHRDVKPANVWLEGDRGRVKLLDFGLARPAGGPDPYDGAEPLTARGAVVGTPAYMAPEQAAGRAVDARADLFSLGVVLYQMATGRLPFPGDDALAILTGHLVGPPTPPAVADPTVPTDLSALIVRLLAIDPAARPASAAAVADELRGIEAMFRPTITVLPPADPWSDIATEPEPVAPPPARRGGLPGWVVVAIGLLTLGGGAWLANQIVTVTTPKGTLVIETSDPDVEVVVKKNGAVIRDKTKDREITLAVGDYTIELVEKDGLRLNTDKFEITKNGKATVKVRLDKPPAAGKPKDVPTDSHRRLAEWVLGRGGEGGIYLGPGQGFGPADLARLPAAPFRVRSCTFSKLAEGDVAVALDLLAAVDEMGQVTFADCPVTDEQVERLLTRTLPGRLWGLELTNCPRVTARSLLAARGAKGLEFFHLRGTRVGEDALRQLADPAARQSLINLALRDAGLTDAGLAQVAKLGLTKLNVSGNPDLTARGVAVLAGMTALTTLGFENGRDGDAVLETVPRLPNLDRLSLGVSSGVTDAGLAKLKGHPKLTYLNLVQTPVTDAGLEALHGVRTLTDVRLQGTKVTAAGVKKLAAALPQCSINWDGGVTEPTADPERRLAEWVLRHGGTVGVTGKGLVGPGGALPPGPLRVGAVWISKPTAIGDADLVILDGASQFYSVELYATEVTDTGVARLAAAPGLAGIDSLALKGTRMTDDGLKSVARFRKLTNLDLYQCKGVTDAGLKHLRGLPNLTSLNLAYTGVTDPGLAELRHLNLRSLGFQACKITDAGVAHLKDTTTFRTLAFESTKVGDAAVGYLARNADLEYLDLTGTAVTDAGMDTVAGFKKLNRIALGGVPITDAGFARLKHLPRLRTMDVRRTRLTDEGLDHLGSLPGLDLIDVRDTKVTPAKAKAFAAARPWCHVIWDGGERPPNPGLGRTAAAWVLSVGGRVKVAAPGKAAWFPEKSDELPADGVRVLEVNLANKRDVDDAGVERLRGLRDVEQLVLWETGVTDRGLDVVRGMTELRSLHLGRTKVTGPGLATLAGLTKLQDIHLNYLPIEGEDLRHLAGLTSLEWVALMNTKIDGRGLRHLKGLSRLKTIYLHNTAVDDAGMVPLKDLPALVQLDAYATKITDAGLVGFRTLSGLRAEWTAVGDAGVRAVCANKKLTSALLDGTTITDAALADLGKLPALTNVSARSTAVTDAGLAHLEKCPSLRSVNLDKTRVTQAGVTKLTAALPACVITWDGGVIHPPTAADRKAAEGLRPHVPRITVRLRSGVEVTLKPDDPLPDEPFAVTQINTYVRQYPPRFWGDVFLPHAGELRSLASIYADVSPAWTDADLARLAASPAAASLRKLNLPYELTPAGIDTVKLFPRLNSLNCDTATADDRLLEKLGDWPVLYELGLRGLGRSGRVGERGWAAVLARGPNRLALKSARVDRTAARLVAKGVEDYIGLDDAELGDGVLAELGANTKLRQLHLDGTAVGDADLDALRRMAGLRDLLLRRTKVTDAGVKALAAALPECRIEWDGGVVGPAAGKK